jgi:CheY-like chemotaxis protein
VHVTLATRTTRRNGPIADRADERSSPPHERNADRTTPRIAERSPARVPVRKSRARDESNRAPSSRTRAPLVLIVDDYEDNRLIYSEYLSFVGFRVAEATDGADAVAKAAHLVPDVVVMDLSLPGMDGWEATRAIKSDERTRHVPVIALTGFAHATHAGRAKEAGCDEFITKPCPPLELLGAVEKHLGRKR